MAYFTEITEPRTFTESETSQVNSYVSTQQAAGTTDGHLYVWNISNPDTPSTQLVRMWGTTESAAGYQSVLAGFSPAVPVSVF